MEKNILFKTIQENEYEDVTSFIVEHFLPEEPSFNGIGCKVDDTFYQYMVERCKVMLRSNLCIKAIDSKTSKVLGMKLCQRYDADKKSPEAPQLDGLSEEQISNVIKLANFFRFHRELTNMQPYREKIFGNDDAILDSIILSTSKDSRGMGVGTKLVKQMISMATEQNFKSICVSVSSAFSQRIYYKLGFEVLHREVYKDFEMDGEKIFVNDTGVHKFAAFCVKNL